MTNHYPVMRDEVVHNLSPQDGEVFVDGTFGAGGYTRAILDAADCVVIAIDRDPSAVAMADALKGEYGERFIFMSGCFGDAQTLVQEAGFSKVDGFVLDVGVSSMQLDQAERGFSFRYDAPLDMRMDTTQGQTAADLVNDMEQDDLANLIYQYGEERLSRRIAKRIVECRAEESVETTLQLAEIIRAVVPRGPKDKIDPATRTFQALRIAVNDELGELERGLCAAECILKELGRLVVVSFHSLEDSIVKAFLYERSGHIANNSRYLPPVVSESSAPTFSLVKRKAFEPSDAEVQQNPRSRSAKMRVALRNDNLAWEGSA